VGRMVGWQNGRTCNKGTGLKILEAPRRLEKVKNHYREGGVTRGLPEKTTKPRENSWSKRKTEWKKNADTQKREILLRQGKKNDEEKRSHVKLVFQKSIGFLEKGTSARAGAVKEPRGVLRSGGR